MTHPRRLALAMILLVAATSCIVSAVTWYLVMQTLPGGAVATIGGAAAGGAIGSLFALAFAAGLAKFIRNPLSGAAAAEIADVNGEPEQKRAYQTLIDNEKMARAIIEEALSMPLSRPTEPALSSTGAPHAEALMGWTREEAVGRSVEEAAVSGTAAGLAPAMDRPLSERGNGAMPPADADQTPLLHKDGSEFFADRYR